MSNAALERWLLSPPGRYVLDWECARIDATVADVFGYNALQLGMPQIDLLAQNRIPFRQRAGLPTSDGRIDVNCDLRQLPIAANSIDLVVLPHVLEFYEEPHQILREVERVLIPEGQVVITGFNPLSLWGARRYLPPRSAEFPWQGQYLTLRRVKDWLQLLGFEVDKGSFGCYAPPCKTAPWLQRWQFIEHAGRHGWPFAGGVYLVRAIKRVHSMRLVLPAWRNGKARAKALSPLAQKESPHGQ
ncbi:class I SAM-dependent methyltransferase [Azospira restricta]|uniref:Class I SAM-dependent methyltransferase n=1 Tax=Azospira restricta TaxID=404405 RepID=A0A974PWP3_9RHOO|nr:class I SAM-dependent methyltransferase [Azospira restricta]QRJ62878.1 class I SAM-dependent methyltransferase [Azospira restricta]